jgi:hypothetical protein
MPVVSNQEHRPASIMAAKGPNLTNAEGVVQKPVMATPVALSSEQNHTIELQAARIKQLEDLLRQANEVIGVQGLAIKKQEQVIIGQVGTINQMRIQIQQARHN